MNDDEREIDNAVDSARARDVERFHGEPEPEDLSEIRARQRPQRIAEAVEIIVEAIDELKDLQDDLFYLLREDPDDMKSIREARDKIIEAEGTLVGACRILSIYFHFYE